MVVDFVSEGTCSRSDERVLELLTNDCKSTNFNGGKYSVASS